MDIVFIAWCLLMASVITSTIITDFHMDRQICKCVYGYVTICLNEYIIIIIIVVVVVGGGGSSSVKSRAVWKVFSRQALFCDTRKPGAAASYDRSNKFTTMARIRVNLPASCDWLQQADRTNGCVTAALRTLINLACGELNPFTAAGLFQNREYDNGVWFRTRI